MFAAVTFSSRCATFDVPENGQHDGAPLQHQASAIWLGGRVMGLGDLVEDRAALSETAGGNREPGNEADAVNAPQAPRSSSRVADGLRARVLLDENRV